MTTKTTASPGTETAAPETGAAVTTIETTAADPAAPAAPAAGTTDTKAAATEAGTLLTGDVADKAVSAPADWPSDWRDKMAGGDDKLRKQLDRYASPIEWGKKAKELEAKLSSGEYKRDLPKDATPEQVAAWRAERGLPEKPEGYLENLVLPQGMVLGEEDKPIAAAFAEAALEGGVPPEAYNKLVAKYYAMQDKIVSERAEADRRFRSESEEELRAQWGPEFKANLNAAKNLLASWPEEAVTNFMAGRLADGGRIGDSPGILKWLSGLSRELNPAATLVPAGTGDVGKSIGDEIAGMEKMMRDRSSDYWRGPKAEATQQRYRDLIEARERIKAA